MCADQLCFSGTQSQSYRVSHLCKCTRNTMDLDYVLTCCLSLVTLCAIPIALLWH